MDDIEKKKDEAESVKKDDDEIVMPDIDNLPDGVEFPFKPKFHKPKFKFVTKRDIPIIVVIVLIVMAATCPKPCFTDMFFCWRPAFWKMSETSTSYSFSIPSAESDSSADEDKIVIKDVSSEMDKYPTPEDYIHYRVDYEMYYASIESAVTTTEQLDICELGSIKTSSGLSGYYMIFTPGGEYSGNKSFMAILSNGEKMISVTFRSRWMKFENNYKKAFTMIDHLRLR